MQCIEHSIRRVICMPVILYQKLIRPILAPCCRFYPSCSDYAITAIMQCGIIVGLKLIICRVLRCHPGSYGGYDPVPNSIASNKEKS